MPKPLYPQTVTAASRIMLPTYVVMYALIGFAFLFQRPQRTDSPHFEVPKMLMGGSIRPWGAVFIVMSIVLGLAMFTHRRAIAQWVLVAGAGMAGFWGGLFVLAGFTNPDVSFTAGIWVISWVACFSASIASLGRNEVS